MQIITVLLSIIGVAIAILKPIGYWSTVIGLSVIALASYIALQSKHPRVGASKSGGFSFKKEFTAVEDCKKEAKKSLYGVLLVFSGLLVMYLGSRSDAWLLTTIIGFSGSVMGAIRASAYLGCLNRLNEKRVGRF